MTQGFGDCHKEKLFLIHSLMSGKIPIERLRNLSQKERWNLPRICGVYFLLKGDSIIYVGQSINALNRIHESARNTETDSFAIIPLPPTLLNDAERYYIDQLHPIRNRMRGVRESHWYDISKIFPENLAIMLNRPCTWEDVKRIRRQLYRSSECVEKCIPLAVLWDALDSFTADTT